MVKATIVESVMGAFGFGEDNILVEKMFFPKDAVETAERLKKIEDGILIDEISGLIDNLKKKGYTQFVFENQKMAISANEKLNIEVSVEPSSEAGNLFRENLVTIALDSGFVEKPEQLRAHLHKVSMELAKIKVKKVVEKRDMLVAQAVLSVDDLDKSLNLFMGRIREWYGLHFPELDRLLEKHETYSRLVVKLGRKENFTIEKLEQEGLPQNKSKMIAEVAAASMGADIIEDDLAQIQYMCSHVLELYSLRQNLENYVEAVMDEVAPNTKAVAGSLLGGRLIALAGGLMNLAKLPASTMQILGAEKALFRSLKTKALPPKHGIIFQHPLIHDGKRWQRGKIARALAGKITIAARVDAFKGEYAADDLKADLEKRVQEITERYPNPPPTPAPTKREFKGKQKNRRQNRRNKRGPKR
ncbi:MAG: C/D box methylation guide ribonucleoprotein complex aNOP56 subunit [Candidatus Bathyarchaeota archaeon]|nr:C/D box methylation guide ribonucleoprotein complex aNOP56 subunit [Candidatus Bathyarchaeum tardum]